ncbi:helix-turn-helix domain-containing protein [Rhodanobacter geophilus]|uniref:Helix-turn-helix domain-containing protein n=1 Tax=Rhodanobacter geophilus TaxID=3162488 RepID=A0ABV3QL45_9GAMM
MEGTPVNHAHVDPDVAFGSRLRAAREARGLELETCAHALKLPLRILRKLEQGEYAGIDSRVYLASYIGKYAQHLGIDEVAIQSELARIRQVEPPLVATGGISHSRFLLDRYATAATYVVLTLVFAVPTIWFGVRSTLDRDLSHLTPLDASPVAQQDAQAKAPGKPGAQPVAPVAKAPAPQSAQDQPLMASMTPFPNLGDDGMQPPKVAAPAADAAGGHSLTLSLSADSWVEVIGQDGTRLEYGLLPAGTSKTWHSDQPLDVRIGNVVGAQVSIDGQPVALDGFRHANVAHFRMQIADGKAAAASL